MIVEQMKKAESVTEELKQNNQWEWIKRMNSIHNRAEEIVLNELICEHVARTIEQKAKKVLKMLKRGKVYSNSARCIDHFRKIKNE